MIAHDAVFRVLALCTQRPGQGLVEAAVATAVAQLPWHELVDAAEHHGLDPLLFAHMRAAGWTADSPVLHRLRSRYVQHAHACAVRGQVLPDVLCAMERSRIRLMVLKGAALAYLAYADARLRPMRDVDLLIHQDDLRRAHDVLVRAGFTPTGVATPPRHHHLPALSKTVDGATVTIELHHELLPRMPFLPPIRYNDLASSSLRFELGGVETVAPSREDLLWHAYAHGFAINTLCPGLLRLISLADVVHGAEAWIDVIDWDRVRRHYPRLARALAVVPCLVPWSSKVAARLGECVPFEQWPVRPIPTSFAWSAALRADIFWPGEWWFRMRYGIAGPPDWLWYRVAGHPAIVVASSVRSVAKRLSRRLRPNAPHQLLAND